MKFYQATLTHKQHQQRKNKMNTEQNPNLQALDQRSRDAQSKIDKEESNSKQLMDDTSKENTGISECLGDCKIESDTSSHKFKTATQLKVIDADFRHSMKMIESDDTLTSNAKILSQDTLLQDAQSKFNSIMQDQFETFDHQLKTIQAELFTNKSEEYSLSPVDIAMMNNQDYLTQLIDEPYTKTLGKNGNARIVLELFKRGVYEGKDVAHSLLKNLNRSQTPESYSKMQDLKKNVNALNSIYQKQNSIFKKLSHSPKLVSEIKSKQYKKAS